MAKRLIVADTNAEVTIVGGPTQSGNVLVQAQDTGLLDVVPINTLRTTSETTTADPDQPAVPEADTNSARTVQHNGTDYRVIHNETTGWGVHTGENLDLVPFAGGGYAHGFASADDAISAITGQRTDEPTSTNTDTDVDGM